MNKSILMGFASSASFITLLLMTHSANATPITSQTNLSEILSHTPSVITLNLSSPYLSQNDSQSNPILEHLSGCNCLTCTQSITPISL